MFSVFSPQKDIRASREGAEEWSDGGLKSFGLPGFNDTRLKPGAYQVLSIDGRPLLVIGQYGHGRTVAFTGFTPAYSEQHAEWDDKIVYPYLVDQELYRHPVNRAYLYLFMELLAAASGEKPRVDYETLLAARQKPLFETLKNLPEANVKVPATAHAEVSGTNSYLSLQFTNGDRYARLVHVRGEWEGAAQDAPYGVLYDDNYFDLMPGESRTIVARLLLLSEATEPVSGRLIVSGTNVEPTEIAVIFPLAKAALRRARQTPLP
jgi:hypothetical protein